MVRKKGIGSIVLWIMYLFASIVGLFSIAAYLCAKLSYPSWSGLVFCAIALMAEYVLFVLLGVRALDRKQAALDGRKNDADAKSGEMLENPLEEDIGVNWGKTKSVLAKIVIFAALLAGVAMRLLSIYTAVDFANASDNFYFKSASVVAGQEVPSFVHGIVHIHVRLVHYILFLMGNKMMPVYLFQAALQVVSIWFLYMGVKRICGVLPAASVFVFAIFSPLSMKQVLTLSPEVLFLFLFSVGLLLSTAVICGKKQLLLKSFAAGVYAGFLIYLDICGMVLLVFLFGRGSRQKDQGEEEKAKKRLSEKGLIRGITGVLGAMVGFSALILSDAVTANLGAGKFGAVVLAWSRLYFEKASGFRFSQVFYDGYYNMAFYLLMMVGMCFGICSIRFWKDGRQGLWTVELWVLLGIAALGLMTEECGISGLVFLSCAVLFGIALKLLFEMDKPNAFEPLFAEFFAERGKAGSTRQKLEGREIAGENSGTPGKTIKVATKDGEREIKLLDNPMKLPKKHEHRAMDYDYEVAEDDDFDI